MSDDKLDQIILKLDLLHQTVEKGILPMVNDHNCLLLGDPPGTNGLVNEVKCIKSDFLHFKSTVIYVWSGVVAGVTIAVNKLWK